MEVAEKIVVVVQTMAEVVAVPPADAAVAVLFGALLRSHNTLHPSSSLGANHILNSPYPHAQ